MNRNIVPLPLVNGVLQMVSLLGKKVEFIPCCLYTKEAQKHTEYAHSVKGKIVEISDNGWFRVRWYAGETVQHECFKLCDVGRWVKVFG